MTISTNIKNLPKGEYFTLNGYSDRRALRVVRRTAKTATVVEVLTAKDPDFKPVFHVGGFCAHCENQADQTWLFSGLSEYEQTVRMTKGGWKISGQKCVEGVARHFYDFNF